MSEKQKQPEACNVIYNISQGIVATGLDLVRPLAVTLLQIYCLVCFGRMFKISQYLAKLQERKLTA